MISPVFVLGFLTNLPKFFEARLVNHYYIQIKWNLLGVNGEIKYQIQKIATKLTSH